MRYGIHIADHVEPDYNRHKSSWDGINESSAELEIFKLFGGFFKTAMPQHVAITGLQKNDCGHLLHAKTPLHGAFCMEQIKNRTRDVSLSESKEGSGPGVHLYAHPENGSQGSKTANAAPSGVLDGRIFPSPAPIISVFIKIHKIW